MNFDNLISGITLNIWFILIISNSCVINAMEINHPLFPIRYDYIMNEVVSEETTTKYPLPEITCDFEDGLCDYSTNSTFIRWTGPSPSKSSGPSFDKTTGADFTYVEGYYGLCYGSRLLYSTDECRLKKEISLEYNTKFSFWYYMYGQQIGTLTLLADNQILWQLQGRQEEEWLQAKVILPAGSYALTFVANRSIDGRLSSDIAIDDFYLEGQFSTIRTRSTTTTTRTTPTTRYLSNCTFDETLCGWYNEYQNYYWSVVQAVFENDTRRYGPGSDWTSITHPLIGGYMMGSRCTVPYCYWDMTFKETYYCIKRGWFPVITTDIICGVVEYPTLVTTVRTGLCKIGRFMTITSDMFNNPTQTVKGKLISPVYTSKNGYDSFCMVFKFNIWGNGTDGLKLYLDNYEIAESAVLLLTLKGPQYINKWYTAEVNVTLEDVRLFRFIFEPFKGDTNKFATISIDHVEFFQRYCYGFNEIDEWTVATESTSKRSTISTSATSKTTTTTTPATKKTTSTTTSLATEADIFQANKNSATSLSKSVLIYKMLMFILCINL